MHSCCQHRECTGGHSHELQLPCTLLPPPLPLLLPLPLQPGLRV